MKKLELLSGVAVLLLLTGGLVAYAANQTTRSSTTSGTQSTSTTTTTSTHQSDKEHGEHGDGNDQDDSVTEGSLNEESHSSFSLSVGPTTLSSPPSGYKQGTGHALFTIQDNTLSVHVSLEGSNPTTQYSVVLAINGTSQTIASLVTNQAGSGHILAEVLLRPGHHNVTVQVFDTTSFHTSILVLHSSAKLVTTPPPTAQSNTQTESDDRGTSGDTGTIGDSGD